MDSRLEQMPQDGRCAEPPRVTVIIPAFNAEHTLARAVQSVLAQSERSLEVLIVDDCSHDGTADVAMALAASDPRVMVLRLRQNGGKPVAMNRATDLATGAWIALVDADDWFAPTRLERLIDLAEAANVDMVADNQVFVDGVTCRGHGFAFPPSDRSRSLDLDGYLAGSNPLASFDLGMLKPVFRSDFIRRHRVEYHAAARNGQDLYVLLCFFMAGGRALVLDEPLYHYARPSRTAWRHVTPAAGRRYRFDLMREANDHYLATFGARMTNVQRAKLVERGRRLETMRRLHYVKTALRAEQVGGLARRAVQATSPLWATLARLTAARLSGGH